jgi:hypothetical protein
MIDRIIADNRDVALNHSAGPPLPQQVMNDDGLAQRADGRQENLSEGLHRDLPVLRPLAAGTTASECQAELEFLHATTA